MPHAEFVHLRVHTVYSLSEGAIRIGELVAFCRKAGMPACAMTDTNNLFGALDFSLSLIEKGVQPIIGCQLALALGEGGTGPASAKRPAAAESVVVLVQHQRGYGNLLKLLSAMHLGGGDTAEPHITLATLIKNADGLILLTGGASGPVGRLIRDGQEDAAAALLGTLAEAFPGRLYVELQRHGMEAEAAAEGGMVALADRLGLPLVATNEAFFATPDMFDAHDALICIAEGRHVSDPERRRLTPEHHLKSPAQMRDLFADLPDAVDNTMLIARRCAFALKPVKPMLPAFKGKGGAEEDQALRDQAAAGLEMRLEQTVFAAEMDAAGKDAAAVPYRERLAFELNVICKMGFAGYFLIVAEFIAWAKAAGIPVGPGRGSGAGSVVAWALTITDLDPLRFGLLFERFLNPERVSMPDFDIDFCQDRRDEVIQHVRERYGLDRVAQIITFGKLQARAVLRDVGRVLGMPYGQVDRICKLVPNNPANPLTLAKAMEAEPQFQAMAAADETVARLIGIARRLEGLYRHASTHAAGVVIGDRPLDELIPLYRDPRSDMPVTGFNMKWVETAGLVKFDFLGLKTLTVLAGAVDLLARQGVAVDLAHLPLDDERTFDLLGRGETVGVFQLESAGMRDALRRMKPDRFEDIIAVVALYRPGPMDNIPSYIRRKHAEEEVDYPHPSLREILAETHGIIIYQEQVMQIAQVLAGYSLGGADLLRRAMGKKDQSGMDKQRQSFVDGAVERLVPIRKAEQIFDLVHKFANYGFNKSHAAAYALVAYQTAYLKANHPLAFFASLMTHERGSTDKLSGLRQEVERLGLSVLPPDINASDAGFTVEAAAGAAGRGGIRFALSAIKNVGEAAMHALVAERAGGGPFKGIDDFAVRMDQKLLNKRQLEGLVRAGAFDSLLPNRRRLFESTEAIIRRAASAAGERMSGQISLFGGPAESAVSRLALPEVADWAPLDRLREECEAVGFYLSAHPLDAYRAVLARRRVVSFAELVESGRDGGATMAGVVMAKRERTSGKGNRYAFVQFTDTSGVFEVTLFSEVLNQCREWLDVGAAALIKVTAQFTEDAPRLTATAADPLDRIAAETPAEVIVCIDSEAPLPALARFLQERNAGRGRVRVVSALPGGMEVEVCLPKRYAVTPEMVMGLRQIAGIRDVRDT